jgi:hypothetical protein
MKRQRDREMERQRDGETERWRDREKRVPREGFSLSFSFSRSLRPSVSLSLFLSLLLVHIIAEAQTGVITGRVVTEDGGGLPNVTVLLYQVSTNQRGAARRFSTTTDEEGAFKFTGVPPRAYTIQVSETKGYVRELIPASERNIRGYYRVGDNAVIRLIRGGVITGRVTTSTGEPMIGIYVSATMTRDTEGNPVRQSPGGRVRSTDDRGVYRIYGLSPGTYVVGIHAANRSPQLSAYDGDAPTYHPSSTRDTAAEVTVSSGAEVTSVDIRHRGESGHVVSGTLTGGGETSQPNMSASVTLISVATGAFVASSYVRPGEASNGFAIYGVSDGEYEIVAIRGGYNEEESFVSPPRRITVRGADVGGIELRLAPMASVAGKIVLEKSENVCESKRKASIDEVVVSMRRDEKASRPPLPGLATESAPADKGEFLIRYLDAGRYFIEPRLPLESWYVKSIAASAPIAPAGARRPAATPDLSRSGVTLKPGEKISGLTVAVADGAASLGGKVVAAKEGVALPSRVRLHLVPAETAEAGNVLRYAEAVVRNDGAFTLNNVAPGKYWLVTRAVPDDEPSDRPPAPVAWDANERAKLRREAEALKVEVELKACQRAAEQIVKFAR